MWSIYIKREQLLDTLQLAISGEITGAKQIRTPQEISINITAGLCLLWKTSPRTDLSPPLIVVADGTKRDFLAWLATYYPPLRPITRDCRVLEYTNLVRVFERKTNSNTFNKYLGVTVGLIVSEAILNNAANNIQRDVTFRDCLETFSFSFGRALLDRASFEDLSLVEKLWRKAQKNSSRTHALTDNVIARKTPWSLLAMMLNQDQFLKKSWSNESSVVCLTKEIENNKKISKNLLHKVSKSLDIPSNLFELTGEGSRESRMVALEEIYSKINEGNLSRSCLAQFVSAFLVYQLEPGTLNYLSLLISEKHLSSEVAMWYGFLAGLTPRTKVLLSKSGLGLSVANELIRKESVFDCLNVDLDAEELDMLIDSESYLSTNKAQRAGSLTVELIPGVKTLLATGENDHKKIPGQKSLFEQELPVKEAKRILCDLDNAMRHLKYVHTDLKKLSNKEPKTKSSPRKK
ncbi:MAG: hypothetical protein ABFS18_11930 [Thermodesulfobacteriota bacterium]